MDNSIYNDNRIIKRVPALIRQFSVFTIRQRAYILSEWTPETHTTLRSSNTLNELFVTVCIWSKGKTNRITHDEYWFAFELLLRLHQSIKIVTRYKCGNTYTHLLINQHPNHLNSHKIKCLVDTLHYSQFYGGDGATIIMGAVLILIQE